MWRSRVRHTLDKTSCLIKHQNKPQQYRHFVLKQRLNLGNEWGLVCGAVWAACRDAISLWPINSPFVLLKTTDWPGLVRAEAGQTINKLVASSLQIQSVAGPLGPISGDATVWKQRRAESLLHTILNSDHDEANEPSPDCVLDSSSWWCNPGQERISATSAKIGTAWLGKMCRRVLTLRYERLWRANGCH